MCFLPPHTRLRVRQASGIPCALSSREGWTNAKLGRILPRGCGSSPQNFVIASQAKQSRLLLRRQSGLLRRFTPRHDEVAVCQVNRSREAHRSRGNVFPVRAIRLSAAPEIPSAVGVPMHAKHGEMHRSCDSRECDMLAAEALELARRLPPGPKRSEALKAAGRLRHSADAARGLGLAKRGRPQT